MKTSRDIKFVIYQVLYIFVICIISLKGADINLDIVLDSKEAVKKSIADSLSKFIDSLLSLKLTNKDSTVDISKIIEDMKKDVGSIINTGNGGYIVNTGYNDNNKNDGINDNKNNGALTNKDPDTKTDPTSKVVGPQLTQYTITSITNPYNGTLDIYADGVKLVSIPSKSKADIRLAGQKQIKYQVGELFDIKETKERKAPQIVITRIGSSGENASLRAIQNTVGFRVEIVDDFPGQLNTTWDGPVKITKAGPTTFDVTLDFIKSETAFDSWTKTKDSPYKVAFFITVENKLNPAFRIKQGQTFIFGKW